MFELPLSSLIPLPPSLFCATISSAGLGHTKAVHLTGKITKILLGSVSLGKTHHVWKVRKCPRVDSSSDDKTRLKNKRSIHSAFTIGS